MDFKIHESFQNVVQGEGYHAGRPCDFIRLYGCPVGCYFCDTGYAKDNTTKIMKYKIPQEKLLDDLKSNFVVISGGEPFIHKNINVLCENLIQINKDVAIETSGAFYQNVNDKVWITLSPKHHISPKYPVKQEVWQRANELKIVVDTGYELDFYKDFIINFNGYKYLQPEFDDMEKTLPLVLKLLQTHQDFKLSLQTHKIIGVR